MPREDFAESAIGKRPAGRDRTGNRDRWRCVGCAALATLLIFRFFLSSCSCCLHDFPMVDLAARVLQCLASIGGHVVGVMCPEMALGW